MKILNVSNTLDPVTGGGEAERSFQMSKFLAESGADCQVLTVDTGLSEQRKNFLGSGRVIALPCISRRFYIPKLSIGVIDRAVARADIVHLMGHWTLLNALAYLSIRRHRKPYAICPAGALPIFGRSKLLKHVYNFLVGKRIVRNASICIAVTRDERSAFNAYGVNPEKVHVIPNGIAEEDFVADESGKFRERFGLGSRPFILFVGRLNLIKGPDLLLQAFCRLKDRFPDIDLVFAGPDGGMQEELKRIVADAGVTGRVHFVGYIGGEDKSCAYHAATFLTIPSRQEAMSIVVLEAGITGTPALITDQCGFDQLADFHGGWVVPATIDGIAAGLAEILEDPAQIKASGVEIKKYVTSNFLWSGVVREYWKLYADYVK